MNRLKAIGTALLAVGVTAAAIAAPAFGSTTINADSYPASYTGTSQGNFTLSGDWGAGYCSELDFSAQAESPVEELGTSSEGGVCAGNSLEMNGCSFEYHPGSETSFGVFDGTYDIGPPGCGPVKAQVGFCKLSIGPQTGLSATYENLVQSGREVVQINSDTSELELSTKAVPGCPGKTYSENSLTGSWLLTKGSAGDTWVESQHEPLFEAASYPTALTGSQDAVDEFKLTIEKGMTVTCETADFSGELSGAAETISLAPTFAECEGFYGVEVAVKANSCAFEQFAGLKVGRGEYLGTLGIDCPGSGIEISTGVCSITIEPQEGLEGVGYVNDGSGISIGNAIGNSVKYTKTKDGIFCPFAGTGSREDGQLQVKIGLSGDNDIRVGG